MTDVANFPEPHALKTPRRLYSDAQKRLCRPLLALTTILLFAAASASRDDMLAIGQAGFTLDARETTNAEMAAFLNEMGNPRVRATFLVELRSKYALIEELDGIFKAKDGYADHPAIEVSFEGARAYCEWAGKALPAEAQWQQACSGPDSLVYPWGDEYSTPDRANIKGAKDGFPRTAPVGSFPQGRSPNGLWDMGGNVWEWTVGPEDRPILRGGSWSNGPMFTRCSKRDDPSSSHSFFQGHSVGFRCAQKTP
ncbi:MAG: SUMF1/EgtB/PvdO family nonheme iron enzyme [Candidatus Latescibacteria bacterium]|nr:SUMF1/EgtB/PvdO family nonheme iron enzyme [Candidatus Latescibacterota bacterium]